MKIGDFRIQTTQPDSPSAGVIGVYSDPSGALVSLNSAGTRYTVGQLWTGSAANMGFAVSQALSLGITGSLTGAAIFLPVIGPSGVRYAFPVWRTT